ncbi:hypothetical protein OSB04_027104 [Centaurea solstitialis]|uniref:Chlororespiratory reduction 7 n=1 Tax=Centaurea solstitialis TaxID=347529 RepID=A0AA38SDZ4_9ASTR|nr:hypothetical protein OSB04_027104 [Centaurea solstitialis]
MVAAISVLSPKSTTALQTLNILKQPNSKLHSGCPLEGFSLNLKPGGGSKARTFPGLVVSASAGTTTTAAAGGGRLDVNCSVGHFLDRGTKAVKDCIWLFSSAKKTSSYPKFPIVERHYRNATKVYAGRRRRSNMETDTYVLMEPGKAEEFVTEEELRVILKGWLENWPGTSLPPDLAIFESIDDAVSHLVKSVCELEIDGDVGSIQWYQVRLE